MDVCDSINTSKLVWGMAALCVNMGSRFVIQDITPLQERIMQHALFKRLVLFCIIFLSTRDVMLSGAITAFTWVILDHLLNEASAFCLVPGACNRLKTPGGPMLHIRDVLSRRLTRAASRRIPRAAGADDPPLPQ